MSKTEKMTIQDITKDMIKTAIKQLKYSYTKCSLYTNKLCGTDSIFQSRKRGRKRFPCNLYRRRKRRSPDRVRTTMRGMQTGDDGVL